MVKNIISRKQAELFLIPIFPILVSLVFNIGYADPLNPIKLLVLILISIFAFSSVLFKIHSKAVNLTFEIKIILLITISLSFSLIIAFINTDSKSVGLIGFSGRNNGLLSYIALIIILLYTSLHFSNSNLKIFYRFIFIASLFFGFYGLMQHLNQDPVHWETPYNPIILTLGNPNFAGALFGILSTLLFAFFLYTKKLFMRFALGLMLFLILIVTYLSQARQGLVTSAMGIGFLVFVRLWQINRKFSLIVLFIEFILGIVSVLGMLQIGPFTRYLYKSSINDRGYNWRAAWQMFKSHPWFGVGIDGFASYFPTYRDSKYPLIYGYEQTVNNAHNVFLQFLATGGVFVFASYLLLVIFIAWRGFMAWRLSNGRTQILVAGIFAAWLAYLAQSIISIDNLAISIWGWILGGALIGLSLSNKNFKSDFKNHNKKNIGSNKSKSSILISFISVLLALGFFAIAVPIHQNETRFLNFKKLQIPNNQDGRNVLFQLGSKAFYSPLMNSNYRILIAVAVTNVGEVERGKRLFEEIIKSDPRRYDAYQFLASILEQQKQFKSAIPYRREAQKINPFGADSLLELQKDYLAINDKSAANKVMDSIQRMAPNSEIAKQSKNLIT